MVCFLLEWGILIIVEVGDSEGFVDVRNRDTCDIVAFVWIDTTVIFNPLAMAFSIVLLPVIDVLIFVTSVVVFSDDDDV
jgi:hypothetical protein